MRIIHIRNYTAATKRAWFVALSDLQAFYILTGYGLIYEADDITVRINGRVIFCGNAGSNEYQRNLNRLYRKKEGPWL